MDKKFKFQNKNSSGGRQWRVDEKEVEEGRRKGRKLLWVYEAVMNRYPIKERFVVKFMGVDRGEE